MSSSAAPVANAVEIVSIRRASRPSEKLGTASSMRSIRPPLDEELALADDLPAVNGQGRLHHDAVEVDGHLDLTPDSGRGPKRDVHCAEQLLVLEQLPGQNRLLVRPDAELRHTRSVGTGHGELLHQLLPHLPGRV